MYFENVKVGYCLIEFFEIKNLTEHLEDVLHLLELVDPLLQLAYVVEYLWLIIQMLYLLKKTLSGKINFMLKEVHLTDLKVSLFEGLLQPDLVLLHFLHVVFVFLLFIK